MNLFSFGHTASDQPSPIYRRFCANTPNFVAKFTKVQYFAVAILTDFINDYTYERRSVYEQELNIASLKQLFDNLNTF
jgi:hypothetical protein